MRVLTFSKVYPSYHPRRGELTHFVEKIWAYLADNMPEFKMPETFTDYDWYAYYNCRYPKLHTIRAGNRWKAGDWFSPRIWSDLPYRSKQIEFAPPMQVKKTYSFIITENEYLLEGKKVDPALLKVVATNDGLSVDDFEAWFRYPQEFNGQIICWGDVNY